MSIDDGVWTNHIWAQTWAELPSVQVSPAGISSLRAHHLKLLLLQEIACGMNSNLSPYDTSVLGEPNDAEGVQK